MKKSNFNRTTLYWLICRNNTHPLLIYVFIFAVVIIVGYFYNKGSVSDSGFSYGLDSITINSRNLRIDYLDILKVEADISSYTVGGVMYFAKFITYRAQNNKIKSFRFYLSLPDGPKWEEFKVKLKAKNPRVKINESVF